MTKNDRRTKKLLGMLQLHKKLEVKKAVDALEVSEATARRLFARLEKEGKLLRVRGAIQIAPQLGYDYSYQASVSHRNKEKRNIGRAAAELVENQDLCGPIAEKTLMMFHVNKAFLGTNAISLEHGFMATDEWTLKINELAVKQADKVYVLADSEKFQKSSFISYAPLDAVDAIFTDDSITRETRDAFTKAGARIEIVQIT